jgi:hypothetical protein
MADLHIFKSQIGMFDPLALQDQNVIIHHVQKRLYRRVDFFESIPPFQCIDIAVAAGAAIAATSVSGRQNIVNLEMADDEFGLFRWYPIDDAQIRLAHTSGITKFQLRNIQVPVDMNILFRDPNLVSTEIAVWEDNRPAVEAVNGHAYALTAVRIIAMGYRFHTINLESGDTKEPDTVEKMKARSIPVTDVWTSGRATSG